MLQGRKKVFAALRGEKLPSPAKGEILITPELVRQFGHQDISGVLEDLQADLATFSLREHPGRENWRHWARENYFLCGLLDGPFNRLAEKSGWMTLLRQVVKDPLYCRDQMRLLLESQLAEALTVLDCGCDGLLIGDDLAGSQGLFAAPRFFREGYFPLLAEFLYRLENSRVPVFFHSCGQVSQLIPDLQESGFWGLQGLQPSAGISPATLLADRHRPWTYWGNFEFEGCDGIKPLPQVIQEVGELLDNWSSWPQYIFGSSGGLVSGMETETIKAAYQKVQESR